MLAKMKIRLRLYGGFGLLLALAIIGSAFSLTLISRIESEVGLAQRFATNALRNLEIGRTLEIMRRTALRFTVSAEQQAKVDFIAFSDEARAKIQQQIDNAVSPQRKAMYGQVKAGLESQRSDFDKLITLVEGGLKAKGEMRGVGDRLAADTKAMLAEAQKQADTSLAWKVDDAEQALLIAQIETWRSLAALDAASLDAAKAAVARANTSLSAAVEAKAAGASAVNEAFAAYAKTYQVAVDNLSAGAALYQDRMRPEIAATVEIMDDARASLLKTAAEARSRSNEALANAQLLQYVAVGAMMVIGVALAFIIGGSIAGPIGSITAAMRGMAGGSVNVDIPGEGRRDEVGDMAQALGVFKSAILEREALAERDRQEQVEKAKRAEALSLLNEGFSTAFKEVGDGIVASSRAVDADSNTLALGAQRTAEQADEVAQASTRASNNVATVAAAAEELRASITEINGQVLAAARASTDAVEQSKRASETVRGLAAAAERIGQVVSLINAIASQTNLLALNATIEAARAGEAGKGFAVVAAEVKGLANQTASATGEIQSQVDAIQTETSRAVEAISDIAGAIISIQEITTSVAGAVEEQTAATAEISRSVQQASEGTNDVARAIAVVSSATEATGAAIESLRSTSEGLSAQAQLLQTQVTDFIDKARQV